MTTLMSSFTNRMSQTELLNAYRIMRTIREFEERVRRHFALVEIPGFVHLYAGEEAIAAGVCATLRSDDYIASTHRGHGHAIAKGCDVKLMMAEWLARRTGLCKGKGGSMHSADFHRGMRGANGVVGGGIPLICGQGGRRGLASEQEPGRCPCLHLAGQVRSETTCGGSGGGLACVDSVTEPLALIGEVRLTSYTSLRGGSGASVRETISGSWPAGQDPDSRSGSGSDVHDRRFGTGDRIRHGCGSPAGDHGPAAGRWPRSTGARSGALRCDASRPQATWSSQDQREPCPNDPGAAETCGES